MLYIYKMNKKSVIRKELLSNLTEENVKLLTEDEAKYLYYNQYDEDLDLPPVDQMKEEGYWVYKIYRRGLKTLLTLFTKHYYKWNSIKKINIFFQVSSSIYVVFLVYLFVVKLKGQI